MLTCEAFVGAGTAAAWTVVTVLWLLLRPPKAAMTTATTAPPMRAERKGIANVFFMDEKNERSLVKLN